MLSRLQAAPLLPNPGFGAMEGKVYPVILWLRRVEISFLRMQPITDRFFATYPEQAASLVLSSNNLLGYEEDVERAGVSPPLALSQQQAWHQRHLCRLDSLRLSFQAPSSLRSSDIGEQGLVAQMWLLYTCDSLKISNR